jgi:hypothetical protein
LDADLPAGSNHLQPSTRPPEIQINGSTFTGWSFCIVGFDTLTDLRFDVTYISAETANNPSQPSTHQPDSQSSVPTSSVFTAQTNEAGRGGESQRRQVQYLYFRTEDGLWKGNYTWRTDEGKPIYKPEKNAASLLKQLRQRLDILDRSVPAWRGVLNPEKTDWSTLVEYFKASLKAEALAGSANEDHRMTVYLADLGQRVYISLNWHLDRIIREENGKAQSLLWLEEFAPQIIKIAKGELSTNGQNRRVTSFGKTNTDDIAPAERKFFWTEMCGLGLGVTTSRSDFFPCIPYSVMAIAFRVPIIDRCCAYTVFTR